MIAFRERNKTVIGALGLVVIGSVLAGAFSLDKLVGGDTFKAEFSEAAGLQPNDEVRVAGMAALRTTDGTREERVRSAIASFVNILTDDPRKGRVAMVESVAYEPLRTHRRGALRGFAQMVADEAALLYGDRAWPPHQGEINGLLFVGGLAELVTAWLNGEIDITPAEIVDAATFQFTSTAHR